MVCRWPRVRCEWDLCHQPWRCARARCGPPFCTLWLREEVSVSSVPFLVTWGPLCHGAAARLHTPCRCGTRRLGLMPPPTACESVDSLTTDGWCLCCAVTFRERIKIGDTSLTAQEVQDAVQEMGVAFRGNSYHLLQKCVRAPPLDSRPAHLLALIVVGRELCCYRGATGACGRCHAGG